MCAVEEVQRHAFRQENCTAMDFSWDCLRLRQCNRTGSCTANLYYVMYCGSTVCRGLLLQVGQLSKGLQSSSRQAYFLCVNPSLARPCLSTQPGPFLSHSWFSFLAAAHTHSQHDACSSGFVEKTVARLFQNPLLQLCWSQCKNAIGSCACCKSPGCPYPAGVGLLCTNRLECTIRLVSPKHNKM
jgi:hypothetical protein